jgi:myo-inositol-1(or 4)-monophosphatase
MSELLELARALALRAGKLQRARLDEPRKIETKSTAIDLVTDVDKASEELIIEGIERARPHDGILSEEAGKRREGSSGARWIIDPLDGTVNYAHAVPHFCVSIGVEVNDVREVGVIYNPNLDELFWAERGRGAFLNGRRIEVSKTATLQQALLATGFAYNVHSTSDNNLDHFVNFMLRARAVRRFGSAALDLAYVACGRFDAFWERSLHPWDVAAGLLLCEEAGAIISDFKGGPAPASGADTVAATPLLHPQMLEVLTVARV